jgi:hypothetical protein
MFIDVMDGDRFTAGVVGVEGVDGDVGVLDPPPQPAGRTSAARTASVESL